MTTTISTAASGGDRERVLCTGWCYDKTRDFVVVFVFSL